MKVDEKLWAVEWHTAGGVFCRKLSDAVAWARRKRERGEPLEEAIVGIAESLDKAREMQRDVKRIAVKGNV